MTEQSESGVKSILCHNCGHDNLSTAKICIVCDSPLTQTARFQKSQPMRSGLLPPTEEESRQTRLEEQKLIDLAKQKYQINRVEEEQQQAKSATLKTATASLKKEAECLDCGHMNRIGDLFCIECGAGLSSIPKKEPPADITPPPSNLVNITPPPTTSQPSIHQMGPKCLDCGYTNRVGDMFCLECGANLPSTPPEESPADITQKMKAMSISEVQAEVEKQKASALVASHSPSLNIAKPELKSLKDGVIYDGCFQFTSEMRLQVTDIETGDSIEVAPSKDKPLLVGRNHESLPIQPEVDLTPFLMDQHGVSRRHALIRLRDLRLEVQDLNSTNGTRINGFRFQPKETHQIRNGDIVTFGRINVKVLFLGENVLHENNETEKLS